MFHPYKVCKTHRSLQSNVYIDSSNVDICHCNARVIVSHTWVYARLQVAIECVAIAVNLPFLGFDFFDRLSA